MMPTESTVSVNTQAFGEITVGIELSDSSMSEGGDGLGGKKKSTLVLVHSFSTSTKLYRAQFSNPELLDAFNLVAIDSFGHGRTTGVKDECSFWDQAELVLATMDKLAITHAYILGTSQGGFIAARCALLQPDRILGIAIAGTSLYSETDRLGSWKVEDVLAAWQPVLGESETPVSDDWGLPEPVSRMLVVAGLGETADEETHGFWRAHHERVYRGSEGQRKFRMIAYSLAYRDNLSDEQLGEIKCPVLILHGTEDKVYSVALMQEWAKKLPNAKQNVVEGGSHFLAASHPKQVTDSVLQWHRDLALTQ